MTFSKDKLATRVAGKEAMAAFAPFVPTMVGGAADLSESTKTRCRAARARTTPSARPGRNVFFGVREHGMGGAVNGMAAHGGIVRPYGSTFLQFADYMRGSIRLSALMGLHVAWVFTHDSVGLGEDGPTHQPVEHLAALRAIPQPHGDPPGRRQRDRRGVARRSSRTSTGRGALALSRQDVPPFGRGENGVADATGLARGAYVLREAAGRARDDRRHRHRGDGRARRRRPARRRGHSRAGRLDAELGAVRRAGRRVPGGDDPRGARLGLGRGGRHDGLGALGGQRVGIDRFGASAPGPEVLERLGITPEAVAQRVRDAARLSPDRGLNSARTSADTWAVMLMYPRSTRRIARGPQCGPRGDGARGTRTPDLLGAIQALSQLSYSPAGRPSVSGGHASHELPRQAGHLLRPRRRRPDGVGGVRPLPPRRRQRDAARPTRAWRATRPSPLNLTREARTRRGRDRRARSSTTAQVGAALRSGDDARAAGAAARAAREHRRHAHRDRPQPRDGRRHRRRDRRLPRRSAQLVDGRDRPQGTLAVSVASAPAFAAPRRRRDRPGRDRRDARRRRSASTLRGVPLGTAARAPRRWSSAGRGRSAPPRFDAPGFDGAGLARDRARAGVRRRRGQQQQSRVLIGAAAASASC